MIEYGFKELKHDIGSQACQARTKTSVTNHLYMCMLAITIVWIATLNLAEHDRYVLIQLDASGLIKDFGTSKSAKIESLPSAFILSGGTAPSQTASTKTTYSSTQPDSCMPLRRDNIALGRTCSRAFGTYAAPSFQPRLPCLLDLAPLSMSRSGG